MQKTIAELTKRRMFNFGKPLKRGDLEKFWAKNTMFRLPKEFVDLCELANGIKGDCATIYAIYPADVTRHLFPDVLSKNKEEYNRVILGENVFDRLTYNFETKLYEIVDDDNELIASYSSLVNALAYMLT